MRKSVCLISILLLTLASSLFFSIPKTYANGTELKILPEKNFFVANTTASGTKFTINVTVNNVADLFSWQIGVRWNASLLDYSSISIPSDNIFDGKTYLPAGPDLSVPGYLVYGVSLGPGQTSVSGSGTLCQIEFKIRDITNVPALCEIKFDNIGVDTFLLNSKGLDIPGGFTTKSAYFMYEYAYLQAHTVTVGGKTFTVRTYSNGEIAPNSVVALTDEKAIVFNVTGESGRFGFVNVTIPKDLLVGSPWTVLINGVETTAQITSDKSNTYVYVEFTFGSQVEVKIVGTSMVPEFTMLPLIISLICTASAVSIIQLRKRKK